MNVHRAVLTLVGVFALSIAPAAAGQSGSATTPVIKKVLVTNQKIVVVGDGFAPHAVVLIDGEQQPTSHDGDHPSTRLVVHGGAQKIADHDARIEVRNPKGQTSEPFTTSSQTDQKTITLDDDQTTRRFHVGETFMVYLGTDYEWTVDSYDTGVIKILPTLIGVRGSQGLFEAIAQGQTTLTLTGRPICEADAPCPQFIREFSVTIVVVP